ncbi:beta-lactamase [Rhodanobacter sp. 115]|nr:beta-lactamase [Rhodanobacter sp. 115]
MIHRFRKNGVPQAGAIRWHTTLVLALIMLVSAGMGEAAPAHSSLAPTVSAPALDAFAHKDMQTFGTLGMAAVIVDGDKTTTYAWGVRKLGTSAKVDAHTIFPIGSNTKAFTTAALAILVDEGKLHWNDRVADKLPGFRMYDAYASSEMTVTDLLVHRSGLGLGEGDLMMFPTSNRTRAELVHDIRYLKPKYSFRSGYDYDNVLYVVAGTNWSRPRFRPALGRLRAAAHPRSAANARHADQHRCTYRRSGGAACQEHHVGTWRWQTGRADHGDDGRCVRAGRCAASQRSGHGPLAAAATGSRKNDRWQTAVQCGVGEDAMDAADIDSDFTVASRGCAGAAAIRCLCVGSRSAGLSRPQDHHPSRRRAGRRVGGGDHSGPACSVCHHAQLRGRRCLVRDARASAGYLAGPAFAGLDCRLQADVRRHPRQRHRRTAQPGRDHAPGARAVVAVVRLCRRLSRSVVRRRHDQSGQESAWRAGHQLRSFAGVARHAGARAVRHLPHALGDARCRGCLRHLCAQSRWQHRSDDDEGRFAAGRFQLGLPGSSLRSGNEALAITDGS